VLPLVERVSAAIEGFLALLHAVLRFAHLALAFLALVLDLGLKLERLILGLDLSLAPDGFRLTLCVGQDELRFLFLALLRSAGQEAGNTEAKGDTDNGADDRKDNFWHLCPFRFRLHAKKPCDS